MPSLLSVSEIARAIGCKPRDISDGFYCGALNDTGTVVIGGVRAIPRSQIPTIRRVIRERGKLPEPAAAG